MAKKYEIMLHWTRNQENINLSETRCPFSARRLAAFKKYITSLAKMRGYILSYTTDVNQCIYFGNVY